MNTDQLSGIMLRIEEVYDLADKHISESKQQLISKEIKDMSYDYVSNKIKALKQWIISGQKFDTATVFRFLGVKVIDKQVKPTGCDMCDDGYIFTVLNNHEYAYACSCELGRFRNKSEHMTMYNGQEKTENHKLQTGLIDIDVDVKQVQRFITSKYGKAIQEHESEVECPW